ncbi:GH12 family glycosyl hydrolase domain-containing protein [Streptomyces capparidis]
MRARPRTAAAVVAVLLGVLASLLTTALPAHADEQICTQYGSTTIQGRYTVQNNRWGTSATQCINVTGTGFSVTRADGSVPTNGAPKSYPSIYAGCHYTNCSPGTNLPARIDTISSAPSSISYTYPSGSVYNASYDIWLDPQPKKDGVNQTEIMIWFNRVGPIQPIGSQVGTASVGGRTWEVWTGSNGSNNVISFVAPSAITSWSFDVKAFIDHTVSRGMAGSSWYLTSIQAGFEPWQGGVGLAVNSFSAAVNTGSGGGGGGNLACRVAYTPSTWSNGFTTDVAITNTGSTTVDGWQLQFALPQGQSITNAWNATVSPTSGTVSARSTSGNSRIAPGGTASFGFQGAYSGTFAEPTAFSLNGSPCTVA